MPRIKSADNTKGNSIEIKVNHGNYELKICRMREDAEKDTSSFSTAMKIEFKDAPDDFGLPTSDLAGLISLAPGKLEKLCLKDVTVDGEFAQVVEALSKCQHLNVLDWNTKSVQALPITGYRSLGQALAQLPCLNKIRNGLFYRDNFFASAVITPLLQRPDPVLRNLDVHMSVMTENGVNEGTTRFIEACCNSTSLTNLSLWFSHDGLTDIAVQAIARIIRQTSSLEFLYLHKNRRNFFAREDEQVSLVELAEALKDNQSLYLLSVFDFMCGGNVLLKKSDAVAFLEVLKDHNYTLKDLELPTTNEAESEVEKIEFFVSLNKARRTQLMGTPKQKIIAPAEDWFLALADQKDISVVYYYLHANLTLFSPGPGKQKSPAGISAKAHKREGRLGSASQGDGSNKRSRPTKAPPKSLAATATPAETALVTSVTMTLDNVTKMLKQDPSSLSSEGRSAMDAAMQRLLSAMQK